MSTSNLAYLENTGSAGRQIAQSDWDLHPLGPIACWSPTLHTALSIMLSSGFPSCIAWTDQLHTLFNAPYRELLANRAETLQGTSISQIWPEIADEAVSIFSQAFAGETMFFEDMSLSIARAGRVGPNYFTFSVSPIRDEQGVVCGVLATVIETTEKVLALARHQDAEERYRLSLKAGHMGTWSVDPETGVTVMDEHFASLFGVTPDVAEQGASLEYFTRIIHPDDRANVIAAVTQAMQDGTSYDIDYRTLPETGKTVWVSAKGHMFTDLETGKRRFAGVATDITSRKEADLALREADRRKDEFLAMLAHELRNPLAPIVSAAQMLAVVADNPAQVRHLGQIVTRQANHMTSLVNDLLDVSRVTSGLVKLVSERLDILKVVDESIEQVMPLVEAKRHKLTLSSSVRSALVMGDRKRLVQVVTNLMQNAAKYTPDGGEITVAIASKGERIEVSIQDNGIGMDAELLPFVFDLFTQERRSSDRAQGGLGLGLALVKSLVALHDGEVRAVSDGLERGSTFTVSLPVLAALPHEPLSEIRSMSLPPKSLKMLIVDDNVDAADLLAMLLETSGHEVVVQYSSADALEKAAAEKYDVFLLDIGLPDMDGNELARRLRASSQSAHATLIAVTGYGQEYDKDSSIAAGFDYYFVKPANPKLLINLLAEINPA
jgi:PAS domain S-box-containing protein